MAKRDKKQHQFPSEYKLYIFMPLILLLVSGAIMLVDGITSAKTLRSLETSTQASQSVLIDPSVEIIETEAKPAEPAAAKATLPRTTDKPEGKEFRGDPAWPTAKEMFEFFKKTNEAKFDPKLQISCLRVFLDEQVVAAFKVDANGKEQLVRAFPCSSGYVAGHTPLGKYTMGLQTEEAWLFDNSLAQYGGQITGNILFHSLPSYDGSLNSGLKLTDLNSMGYAASHGCVRLFCVDAKWIYTYCPVGTPIEVLQNRGKTYDFVPKKVNYLRLKAGAPKWDPSDPDPHNPYHDLTVLEKWVVREPWKQNYQVLPPVWPSWVIDSPAPGEPVTTEKQGRPVTEPETTIVESTGIYAPTAAPTEPEAQVSAPLYAPTAPQGTE
ncbi:MAG: L,D-transpeptidase [Eubacteriales bacterium]|nr:L,D-transpeptidase [Eubacteriales bacterium]